MKAFSPVLPSSPEFTETVLAKDQPQYKQLPVAHIEYSDGVKSMISRYKLSWRERWKMFVRGEFWLEQLTFGQCLQPQRPTVDEPLTSQDIRVEERKKLTPQQRINNFRETFLNSYRRKV